MFTYTQYFNGDCTHRQYYAQFVSDTLKSSVLNTIGLPALEKCRGQKWMNGIKLELWEKCFGVNVALMVECGDGESIGGRVCVAKEAARQILEGNCRELYG